MQARILWSLLWRSVFWFPLGVVMCAALVAYPCALILLPLGAVFLFADGSWLSGMALLSGMVPLLAVRRWFVRTLSNDHDPCGSL